MTKSKEFKEGYEAGFANKPTTANPYRNDPQVHKRIEWLTGYTYGNNDRRSNADKRTFNTHFQNGRQKALNAISVKLGNMTPSEKSEYDKGYKDGRAKKSLPMGVKMESWYYAGWINGKQDQDHANWKSQNASTFVLKQQLKSAEKELEEAKKRNDRGDIIFFEGLIKDLKSQMPEKDKRLAWAGK